MTSKLNSVTTQTSTSCRLAATYLDSMSPAWWYRVGKNRADLVSCASVSPGKDSATLGHFRR